MNPVLVLSLMLASSTAAYGLSVCEDLIRNHCDKIDEERKNDPEILRQMVREIVREEMQLAGWDENPWTVFQRRMDGSVNFNRGWSDYVNGFGNKTGEFWLGLEELHRLTRNRNFELRIDMTEVRSGRHWYANYSSFSVGPGSDYYRLTATGFVGNVTDSLGDGSIVQRIHNGKRFSTHDSDHDNWFFGNCAASYNAGWWYDNCYDSNLNGMYNVLTSQGIVWVDQNARANRFMSFVEMKFRRRQ